MLNRRKEECEAIQQAKIFLPSKNIQDNLSRALEAAHKREDAIMAWLTQYGAIPSGMILQKIEDILRDEVT